MVGKVGSVVRDIRGGKLPGEIRVVVAGEQELFLAYSEQPLAVGVRPHGVGRVAGGRREFGTARHRRAAAGGDLSA